MGVSYLKPGIDKTNVNPPMFTHYNIYPVFGTEKTEDEVDGSPDYENDSLKDKGEGIIEDTDEGIGETIIDKPVINDGNNSEEGTGGGSVTWD